MNYMGDEKFWDEKFQFRDDKPLNPDNAVVYNIKKLKKGSVLDIACGDGRNALFLLENDFEVMGIDFSEVALERLRRFSERKNYNVKLKCVDLRKSYALDDLGMFDNILINHFKLGKELLIKLKDHIVEDGILIISGFGHNHKPDFKIRECDLIQKEDINSMMKFFHLISYEESKDSRGFFVTYILKRNSLK